MSIALFQHNQTAYESAVSMFSTFNRVAIIHPTGTGKSFIGFKLCEDNTNKKVCWLSPSEYIFKTQIENWKQAGGNDLVNIDFYTYAKFMNLSVEEIRSIKPDYIVLDEFHRAGAEIWGEGVQRLLDVFPNIPILGLSATAIRYLDNQRNMVEELFDGNVASEMTLGEAIVRGILNPPKYVLSVFNYQKDLAKYEKKIKNAKSNAVRDRAEKVFEALRRALDKADGIDVIFDKHITDRHGKYIVFCSGVEHMNEMIDKAQDWFSGIDKKPHIYTAYSDDPETSKAFIEFKKDESEHLKLLYCIDMLNEGVHVDGVSGVILLRPTVSPIIYKQQIGRALSASKNKDPIIFDIVLNIENLYSIGTVQEEMQVAINYYRSLGLDRDIINENFKVVDEVRDCIGLFERLNDTLTASWDLMFSYAKKYYEKHGNLEVPVHYKTEKGYSLGTWLLTQRKVYSGEQYGKLDGEKIKRLESIGMVWDSYRDLAFSRNYEEAKKYYEKNGDLLVPALYKTEGGVKLGAWISNLRTYRKSGIQRSYLTEDRIKLLDRIGMVWSVPDIIWEKNYDACKEFYLRNGHLNIPVEYVTEDGLRIGVWISRIRKARNTLDEAQVKKLDSIGMIWEGKFQRAWNKGYSEAKKYYKEHGDLKVPTSFVSSSGYKLGKWIADRREKGRENHSREQQVLLDEIKMIWIMPDSWEVRFGLAEEYFKKHGNLNVPIDYKVNGIWLNKWLNEQRQIYIGNRKEKTLSEEQADRLLSIGFDFENKSEKNSRDAWERQYKKVKAYYEKYGNLQISSKYSGGEGVKLQRWLTAQRTTYSDGRLSEEQINKLNEIKMPWTLSDAWEIGYAHAKRYFERHNDLNVPKDYLCEDGYKLGNWIQNQRSKYNTPQKYRNLSTEQVFRLKQIGMKWKSDTWERNYEKAKLYYLEHGSLKISKDIRDEDGFCLYSWISDQKKRYKKGNLSADKIDKLALFGTPFNKITERNLVINYKSANKKTASAT